MKEAPSKQELARFFIFYLISIVSFLPRGRSILIHCLPIRRDQGLHALSCPSLFQHRYFNAVFFGKLDGLRVAGIRVPDDAHAGVAESGCVPAVWLPQACHRPRSPGRHAG